MNLIKLLDYKAIIAGLVTAALLAVWSDVASSDIWNGLLSLGRESVRFLTDPIAVPLWIAGAIALYAFYVSVVILSRALRNLSRFTHGDYTEDTFRQLHWQWRMSDGIAIDPYPCCPICKLQLIPIEDNRYLKSVVKFECDDGHGTWEFQKSYHELQIEIMRRIQQRRRLAQERGVDPSSLSEGIN